MCGPYFRTVHVPLIANLFTFFQAKFVDSPVMISKNVKNDIESEGMISSHIRDAVAVCQFAAHLEEQIQTFGFENWTEISASELLLDYRTQQGSVDLLSHFTKVKCDSWT